MSYIWQIWQKKLDYISKFDWRIYLSSCIVLLKVFAVSLFFCLYPLSSFAAESGSGYSNACSQLDECYPAQKNGIFVDNASHKINSTCVKENASSGCFNGMPISAGTGNYNSVGNRGPSRNHYGTDIGATGYTSAKAYPVADEGTVAFVGTSTGGGRTVVINYPKKCTGNGNKAYHTIYRHFKRIDVSVGQKVNRDTVVGIVGGSNMGKCGLCDNPAQGGTCPDGKGCYYAIHLHLELEDGLWSGGGTKVNKNNIMKPYCQNANVLCGGFPSAKDCDDGTKGNGSFGSSGDQQQVSTQDSDQIQAEAKDCNYAQYLDSNDCVFCSLFRSIFNAASVVAKAANDGLALPSRNLVGIGFLIWILVYLFKHLASFGGTSTGEMLKGLLFQGFRVAVVVTILSGAVYWVMDLTINPIMQTGMEFVQTVNSSSTCQEGAEYLTGLTGYEKGKYDDAQGGLSVDMGKSILCSIKNLEDATGIMMNLGNYSMCLGHNVYRIFHKIIPHFGYITTGWVLWLAGLTILLMFPWLLLDCILQLSIAVALAPCAIAAYAFKITSKYLKTIFNYFMNAMFNFVFLALVVYIINSYLKSWLGIEGIDPTTNHKIFVTGGIIDVLTGNAENGLAWWGIGAFKILAICFFCYCFFDEAKSMAGSFASSPGLGGSKGIGAMIGGTMGQAAKNYVGQPALSGAKQVGKAGGQMLNSAVGNKWRSGVNHMKGRVFSRIGSKSTRTTDANGNTVYKSSMNLMGFQINRTVQKDENGIWTQVKEVKQRSGADKAFEKVLDKDGNEVKDVLKDANGNAVKDENGNDVMVTRYVSRQRLLGEVLDKEEMYASRDENGKIVYQTADGKRSFTMGDDGQIASYKTPFTRTLFGKPKEKQATHYRTVRTTNDGFSKTREIIEGDGQVTGTETTFKNVSAQYLVNKDGTINANAFNQIKSGSQNPETAAVAMLTTVMQHRGQKLENTYKNRDVKINKDGIITINQINNDGSKQVIQAQMIGNQMVIQNTTTDTKGNISRQTTNGIRSELETFTRNKDEKGQYDGTYRYRSKTGFTEYVMSKNSNKDPLSAEGAWGNNIDREQAMTGFTHKSYERQIAQLQIQKMQRMNPWAYQQSAEYQHFQAQIMQQSVAQSEMQNILAENGLSGESFKFELPETEETQSFVDNVTEILDDDKKTSGIDEDVERYREDAQEREIQEEDEKIKKRKDELEKQNDEEELK